MVWGGITKRGRTATVVETMSLDILLFIATRHSHCLGAYNLATLGIVNVQVVHV